MEYKDIRCPVCGVPFDDDDDVVVCPECGTPHHRKCYERIGKCANSERHDESFSWNEEKRENAAFSICPNCGAKNPTDAIFCNSCANPIGTSSENKSNQQQTPPYHGGAGPQGMPFGGFGSFNPSDVYSATGIAKDQELAQGVTAQECEKYVKTNVFYYLPVFRNIKNFGKSRFNFSAAIFSGAWFLYRKLYLAGGIFLALTALCLFTESFFFNSFYETYRDIAQTLGETTAGTYQIVNYAVHNLNPSELLFFILPPLASFMRIVLMIVSGCIGNKLYYKNAVKKIQKVKSENPSNLTDALNNIGGTNTIAPAVVIICYFAINVIISIM